MRHGAAGFALRVVTGMFRRMPGILAHAFAAAAVSEALSRAVPARPEQRSWGSRRCLTRPPGERSGSDGLPPRAA